MSDDFDRCSGIGASEASAACGMSRWQTQLELYAVKAKLLPPQEENAPMRWGKRLEPVVLAEFEERMGRPVIERQTRIHHPDLEWLYATIDGRLSADELVEAKTAGPHSAKDYGDEMSDEIPAEHVIQASHQMLASGAKAVWVPVLIAGSDFRIYRVERSAKLVDRIMEMEFDFWVRVQERNPPAPDWKHPATPGLMEALHKPAEGVVISLDDDALELVESMEDAKASAKAFEAQAKEFKARLVEQMRDAAQGHLPDGRVISRKLVERAAYSVAATSFIDFRIKKAMVRA